MPNLKYLIPKKSFNPSSEKINEIEIVLSYLKSNVEFNDIKCFLAIKEETLKDYVFTLYQNHPEQFKQLTEIFSLQHCLQFSLNIIKFDKDLKQSLLKALTYPLILYSFTYGLMMFFIIILFPALNSILMLFDLDLTLIFILQTILRSLFVVLRLFNLGIIVTLLLLRKNENKKLFYLLIKTKRHLSLFKNIYTFQFSYYINELYKQGMSTKQALLLIKNASTSPTLMWLSTLVTYELEEGKPFEESIQLDIFDSQFISLLQLGSKTNQLLELLTTYLYSQRILILNQVSKAGNALKSFTYLFLGLLIIVMYQILLAPMSLMGTL